VFQKGILKAIFGSKRGERVTREWRKLFKEEFSAIICTLQPVLLIGSLKGRDHLRD
jgi:hypothetical protein